MPGDEAAFLPPPADDGRYRSLCLAVADEPTHGDRALLSISMAATRLLLARLACAAAAYPGNFALRFDPSHGDVVRVPHESSMQGPLIDSFTVELWLLAQPRAQLAPEEGRVVNLVGFPGRAPVRRPRLRHWLRRRPAQARERLVVLVRRHDADRRWRVAPRRGDVGTDESTSSRPTVSSRCTSMA